MFDEEGIIRVLFEIVRLEGEQWSKCCWSIRLNLACTIVTNGEVEVFWQGFEPPYSYVVQPGSLCGDISWRDDDLSTARFVCVCT